MKDRFWGILCLLIFLSCNGSKMKFSKGAWNKQVDGSYTERAKILDDLMANHLYKGMAYLEVLHLLGNPENRATSDPKELDYEIMTDYGWDIDPVRGAYLRINLSADSTIKNFKLIKWSRK